MKYLFVILMLSVIGCGGSGDIYIEKTINGDTIVTDESTGHVWTKEYVVGSWRDGKNYCDTLDYAGYTDWALPNRDTLETLVDRSIVTSAPFSSFPEMPAEIFWSSTSLTTNTDFAWYISFYVSYMGTNPKTERSYIRCVQ